MGWRPRATYPRGTIMVCSNDKCIFDVVSRVLKILKKYPFVPSYGGYEQIQKYLEGSRILLGASASHIIGTPLTL